MGYPHSPSIANEDQRMVLYLQVPRVSNQSSKHQAIGHNTHITAEQNPILIADKEPADTGCSMTTDLSYPGRNIYVEVRIAPTIAPPDPTFPASQNEPHEIRLWMTTTTSSGSAIQASRDIPRLMPFMVRPRRFRESSSYRHSQSCSFPEGSRVAGMYGHRNP